MTEVDGVKKINKADIKKSRKIVLDYIKDEIENEKKAVPEEQISKKKAAKVFDIKMSPKKKRFFELKKKQRAKKSELAEKKAKKSGQEKKKVDDIISTKVSEPKPVEIVEKKEGLKISKKDKAMWQNDQNLTCVKIQRGDSPGKSCVSHGNLLVVRAQCQKNVTAGC